MFIALNKRFLMRDRINSDEDLEELDEKIVN